MDSATLSQTFAQPDVTTLAAWPQVKATFLPPCNKQGETEVLPERHRLTHVTKYSQQGRFFPCLLVSRPAEELLNQLARSAVRV